jgi:hypothetical protein
LSRPASWILPLILVAPFAVLPAQTEIAIALAVNSEYQSRGLTTTNRSVVQPDIALSRTIGRTVLLAGGWANVEAGSYDDPQRHISENGGERSGVTEYQFRAEATRPVGPVAASVGVLSYDFPNRLGTTAASNTMELYVRVAGGGPLAPTLTVWHDVGRVNGAYAEIGLSHTTGALVLGVVGGWNAGQSPGDGGTLGFFTHHGLTHLDASISGSFTMGALTLAPTAHVIFGRDPMTRTVAPGTSRGAKLWVGSTLRWVGRTPPRLR